MFNCVYVRSQFCLEFVGGLEGLEVAQPSLSAYLEVRSHLVQVSKVIDHSGGLLGVTM